MHWKTVVIDDESNARETMEALVSDYSQQLEWVGSAGSVADALQLIERTNPDLLLLDVEMPGGNGFDLLRELPDRDVEVIFITAYGNYAVDALRFAALDYLQKPIDREEFEQAIQRFVMRKNVQAKGAFDKINTLLSNVGHPQQVNSKLIIPEISGFTVVDVQDILYLQSEKNYTDFYLLNDERITSSKPIRYYEEMLPSKEFYRINQSYIVKLAAIRQYRKGEGGTVVMEDGFEIDVPRRKKQEFLRLFS